MQVQRKPARRAPIWVALAFAAFAAASQAEAPRAMSVQVQRGELRASPSFLGAVLGTVAYGDRVQVAQTSGAWVQVVGPNASRKGWIHSSALTAKRVQLAAGADAAAGASSGEMALAGKGFNSTVEREFKDRTKLDFSWVDRMVQYKISPQSAQAFLQEGGVSPKGGKP